MLRSKFAPRAPRPATGPLPVEQPPAPRPPPREASFLQIVLAVWASFFGVRKRRMHDELAPSVKPQHLIVAGVLGALFLVLALIAVVRIVIANA
ncbi:MAG: DUF2970 domain-containing protein [Betaproteobacteria bacterium]